VWKVRRLEGEAQARRTPSAGAPPTSYRSYDTKKHCYLSYGVTTKLEGRLSLAREGLRRLCRLETNQWATRAHLFGEVSADWQQCVLQKLSKDKVIEVRTQKGDSIYALHRADENRFRSLAVVTALLTDNWLLTTLLETDDRPTAPVIELPLSSVRRRVMNSEIRPTPLTSGSQLIVTLPPALYAKVRDRAKSANVSIVEYIRLRLSDDDLPAGEPPKG
jgi:hypothetical protein